MHSCWGQHNEQTANEKSKMVVNCKKMLARLPENSVSSQSMAANSWSLGPPSAPAYLVCWFGYAWLWSWIFFSSSWNKLFYSISICFGNDRNSPIRTEVSPVVVDGLQEMVKLIPVAYLNSLSIYCHSMIFLGWFLIYDEWFAVCTCENHLVHRALSDDAIMMVGLRLIIMNTTCFVAFLVWFLNRNSNCVPLNETQQRVWNGMDCLSRCSALHRTEPNASQWKF